MIKVDWDASQLLAVLGDPRKPRNARKMAYAMVNALNATAIRGQTEAREHVRRTFALRTPQTARFIERNAAIIDPRASVPQGRDYVEIAVSNKPRLLLPHFERGARRRPFTPGAKRVAVPVIGSAARPHWLAEVPPAMRFKALALRPQISKAGRKLIRDTARVRGDRKASSRNVRALNVFVGQVTPWQGKHRTFMLTKLRGVGAGGGSGAVFRRFGSGRNDIELLYWLDTDVQLPPTLRFAWTARQAALYWAREELEKSVIAELAGRSVDPFARGRGR